MEMSVRDGFPGLEDELLVICALMPHSFEEFVCCDYDNCVDTVVSVQF